ncbi:SLAM family member 9-like, partial [Clarias magur]
IRSEDMRNVIGYAGETVVLKADVDTSWALKTIRWSIYSNSTLIGTFENNEIKDNRWPPFKDRLKLNKSNGDLTIKNLMKRDSMEYKVNIKGQTLKEEKTSHVHLEVRGEFHEPNITVVYKVLNAGKCIISLKCSSESENVSLMWKNESNFKEHFLSDCPNVNKEALMSTYFTNRDVNFSCIATDYNRNMSSQIKVKCQ